MLRLRLRSLVRRDAVERELDRELRFHLEQEIEKNDRFVLSISTLKKTDDIEKLIKKIRSRMRHN